MPTNLATETPTAPTEQIPGSGTPLQRVPLPEALLKTIRESATASAPAEKVAQTGAQPIAKDDAPEPPAKPAPEAAKPEKPTVAAPAAAAKAAEPREPEKPAAKAEPPGPKQLREALERAKAQVSELESTIGATAKEKADAYAKLAELEAKNKAYEERIQREFEPALKRLTETEKRLQEREEALRVRDYTATPHFHDTYIKPIVETQQEALQFVGELVATVEDGKQVQATQEHLNFVLGAPNANEAARRAEQLFGTTFTPQLVNYRTRLRALEGKRAEAMQKASVESETYFKRQQEEQLAAAARFRQTVEQRVQSYLTKPAEGDPEEEAAWSEGRKFAEVIERGVEDPEERANVAARIIANATSEKLKDLRYKRAQEEIKNLREELKRYQKSEPDVETRNTPAGSADEGAEDSSHAKLMRAVREAAAGRM